MKWVEFAAEFPDLNELNLPTKDEMSLFVYYSLDVISFSIVLFSILTFMLVFLIRTAFRLFRKLELYVQNVPKAKKLE